MKYRNTLIYQKCTPERKPQNSVQVNFPIAIAGEPIASKILNCR